MKLFTPTETITKKQNEAAISLKRSLDFDKEITRKREELQRLNLEAEASLQKQIITQEQEKKDYLIQVNALKQEVLSLEERRRDSLVPITEKWKELETAEKILKSKETKIAELEGELEERRDLLENRLTELADRAEMADLRDKKQEVAQLGINTQTEQIKTQNKAFNEFAEKAVTDFKLKEKILNTREAEILLKEKVVNAKELEQIEKEKSFVARERQIQDKYATLERTINRLKNKQ